MMKISFVCIFIFALALAGCSNSGNSENNTSGTSTERRTIVMGTSADFPPFEFVADHGQGRHGQYSGIDVAIAVRIAEALGADLEIHDAPFDGLIMELLHGRIDFIAAAMTIRPDRAEQVNFSVPYFAAMQYIVVQSNNNTINSAADLEGQYIGVQMGTTGYFFVSDSVNYGRLLPFTRALEPFMELMGGRIDAIVIDSDVARLFVGTYPDALRIISDSEAFAGEYYGIAVRQDDPELLAAINTVLREMQENGEIDALFAYYSDYLLD